MTNEQFLAKIESTMQSLLPYMHFVIDSRKRTIYIVRFSCYHIISLQFYFSKYFYIFTSFCSSTSFAL